jgi:aminoglycoside 3-N-acetyltransferase
MTQAEDLTLHTRSSLAREFRAAGLQAGMHILMHSSMKRIGGWVCGSAEAVIRALMDVITPEGTIMMPAFNANNTDPQYWKHPPVPAEWWQPIREETPVYDPATTITREMGIIAENFRRFPKVIRSSHPITSFAAWGKHAPYLTATHPWEAGFGEQSPLARLYELGGIIFMLGVTHGNNTSMHLAEHLCTRRKVMVSEGCAMLVDGKREWVTFTEMDYDDDPFERIGQHYEAEHHPLILGQVGRAVTRLMPMRPLVDYATQWLSDHQGNEN